MLYLGSRLKETTEVREIPLFTITLELRANWWYKSSYGPLKAVRALSPDPSSQASQMQMESTYQKIYCNDGDSTQPSNTPGSQLNGASFA